ncbi:MAG: hypothetical protein WBM99_13930 [Psychromonas sp.]
MSKKIFSEKELLEGMTPYSAHADELATISLSEFGFELSESEYKMVMKKIEGAFNATPNTQESDDLEKLISLVDAYENKHHTI